MVETPRLRVKVVVKAIQKGFSASPRPFISPSIAWCGLLTMVVVNPPMDDGRYAPLQVKAGRKGAGLQAS